MCDDMKLKEELLKLGEEPGQLNLDTIFTQCQKYEQRMQNLKKPTHDVTVSAVASNSEKTGNCRACAKETPWSRIHAKPFGYCLEHRNSECDLSNLSCNIKGCDNPAGNHNTSAHGIFTPNRTKYKATPPNPRPLRSGARTPTTPSSRKTSKSETFDTIVSVSKCRYFCLKVSYRYRISIEISDEKVSISVSVSKF